MCKLLSYSRYKRYWLPQYDHNCKECEEGYFLKMHGIIFDIIYLYDTCEKICKEGPVEDECKKCNYKENDIDECLECGIHAKLNKDKNECIIQKIRCGNKTFYDCEKCEEINKVNSAEEKDYKCGTCRYGFILKENGTCLIDNNFTKILNNNFIKFQYKNAAYLIFIYLLLL